MEGTLTGGKKWATGTTTHPDSSPRQIYINNLNFKPSVVFAYSLGSSAKISGFMSTALGVYTYHEGCTNIGSHYSTKAFGSSNILTADPGSSYTGCAIWTGGFILSVTSGLNNNNQVRWYAYE